MVKYQFMWYSFYFCILLRTHAKRRPRYSKLDWFSHQVCRLSQNILIVTNSISNYNPLKMIRNMRFTSRYFDYIHRIAKCSDSEWPRRRSVFNRTLYFETKSKCSLYFFKTLHEAISTTLLRIFNINTNKHSSKMNMLRNINNIWMYNVDY